MKQSNSVAAFGIKLFKQWLPLMIGLAALIATVWLWHVLNGHKRAAIKETLEAKASAVERELEAQFNNRVAAIERMAERWARRDKGTPRDEWEADAMRYFKDFSGFQAIEWVDANQKVQWVVPTAGNEAAFNLDLGKEENRRKALETARTTGQTTITHTVELTQGGKGFLVYVPIYRAAEFEGFVLGVFRVDALLDNLIDQNIKENYEITVTDEGNEIYRRGQNNEAAIRSGSVRRDLNLGGVTWVIQLEPNQQALTRLSSSYDEPVLLLIGFAFALLLGLLTFLTRQSWLQSKSAAITNLRLTNEIIERRHAEAEQSRLLATLEASQDLISIADLNQKVIYLNRAGRKLLGIDADAALDALSIADAHPQWAYDLIVNQGAPAAIEKGSWLGETAFLNADKGETLTSQMILAHRNETGAVEFLSTVARDITTQKQAEMLLRENERRFRMLTMHSPVGIFETDARGDVYFVNERWSEITGCSLADAQGKGWAPALHPDDRDFVYDAWYKAVGEEREFTCDFRFRRNGVETVWVSARAVALKDEVGNITGYIGTTTDITESKLAEAALRESENRFRTFMDNLPLNAWILDQNGAIQFQNKFLLESRKQNLEENVGKTAYDLFPPDLAEQLFAQDMCVLTENAPLEGSYSLANSVGEERELSFIKFPIAMTGGRKLLGTIAWDVTEQKRAEKALRESEARLEQTAAFQKAILNSANYSVISTSTDGTIKTFNRTAERWLGYRAEEVVDQATPGLFHVEEEVSRRAAQLTEELGRTIKPGFDVFVAKARCEKVEEREWTFVRKDTSRFDVSLSVTPVYDESEVITGYLGIANDITERKRIEAELSKALARERTMIEYALDVICTIDADGRFVTLSPACLKTWGYRPEELVGQKYLDLVVDEDVETTIEAARSIMLGHETTDFENRYRHKNNAIVNVLWGAVWSEKDQTMYCIARDITERKRIEAELGHARDAALESARLKSEFLANMSHEIRTPMNGVIGMTELLLETALNVEQHEYTETIKTSAHSLLTIINDILDFSKIEAGRLHIETTDFDLNDVVDQMIDIFSKQARQKGIRLVSEIQLDAPRALRGDPGRIRQVLTNLVGNAVKFTERGEISVRAWAESETETDAVIKFSIRDTGIGISKDAQKHLFQPFTQADGSITREYGGTGLGLAISRQLVELMNGRISAESEPGCGSLFCFTIRVEKQPSDAGKLALKSVCHQHETSGLTIYNQFLASERILVAEDNPVNQRVVQLQLERLGYAVEIVANGREAIEAFEQRDYSLVLMDCQMPLMDGFAASTEIRRLEKANKKPATPIVAITANAMNGMREKCLAAGMDDYLAKPFNRGELVSVLGRWSDAKQSDSFAEINLSNNVEKDLIDKPSVDLTNQLTRQVRERFEQLAAECGGEIITALVPLFIDDSLVRLAEITESARKNSFLELRDAAHALKGACANLGAVLITDLCQRLETEAQTGQIANVQSLIEQIQTSLTCLHTVIAGECQRYPN